MSLKNTVTERSQLHRLLERAKRIHFLGIGGVSMAQIAELCLLRGYAVSGYDAVTNERTEQLKNAGADLSTRPRPEEVKKADVVVYSLSISERNKEYREAIKYGIPCLSRADFFAGLLQGYERLVTVSGMNGKSTVSAMIGHCSYHKKTDLFCGAELQNGQSGMRITKGATEAIAEACEYKDSFLHFFPTLAVILNIGYDHVDYFQDLRAVENSFANFANIALLNGEVLANADDEACRMTLGNLQGKIHWFSSVAEAEFTAENITLTERGYSFDFCRNREKLEKIRLPMKERFSLQNALAAASAATLMGIPPRRIATQLKTFQGLARRMEICQKLFGAECVLDYAHHPSAIHEVLTEARKKRSEGKLICVYEPHTFSRTAKLFENFKTELSLADRVILLPIYPAREKNVYRTSSQKLAKSIGAKATYAKNPKKLYQILSREVEKNDRIYFVGAGKIDKIPASLEALSKIKRQKTEERKGKRK